MTRSAFAIGAIALACAALTTATSSADRARAPREVPHENRDFWKDVIDPHEDEVNTIVQQVDAQLQQWEQYNQIYDTTGENRMRAEKTLLGRLKYARKLSPDSTEVLERLGRVADDLGNTAQAIEALEAALALTKDKESAPELTGRLGMIYLRTGDLDQAIRYLRLAQNQVATMPSAQAAIALATALAERQQMDDAIDVLSVWNAPQQQQYSGYYGDASQIAVGFALAVFYDRDDQRSEAFEILDRMISSMQGGYGQQVQAALAGVRFEPAEDKSYYQALLYESSSDYTEARAAWATYAAAGGEYRARALEHVAAIDDERKQHAGARPLTPQQQLQLQMQQPGYPPPPPRRRRP
jgi:tetratricopeptide (TPR) repeat protein|nr:tetratricopeptide repeat protein [Kofleriaceae bacterium]